MSSSFAIRVNLSALELQLDADADAVDDAARPSAQAGAQVIYDEVKRNVAKLKRHTGNLDSSIYQVFSKSRSASGGKGLATYHVSWNARKAPHGHLVEYGHLQRYEVTFDPATNRFTTHRDRPLTPPKLVAAKPFLRPAVSKFDAAMDAASAELFRRLAEKGVVS